MPETDVTKAAAGLSGDDESHWQGELEQAMQEARAELDPAVEKIETEGQAVMREAEEERAAVAALEPDAADLQRWAELEREYGPGVIDEAGEVRPGPPREKSPSDSTPAGTSEIPEPEPSPSAQPVQPAPEPEPAPSPSTQPVEPTPEAESAPSPSTQPVEPQAESPPAPSPATQPVEPAAETAPEASPASQPVSPAAEQPSLAGAAAFALAGGAVLAGGAAALAKAKPPPPPSTPAPEPTPAAPVVTQWFFAESGTTHGPFDLEEVLTRLREGRLSWDTPVWNENMAEWTAAKASELSKLLPPAAKAIPPPPPPLGARSKRFCHSCGTAVDSGDRFCSTCGVALRPA